MTSCTKANSALPTQIRQTVWGWSGEVSELALAEEQRRPPESRCSDQRGALCRRLIQQAALLSNSRVTKGQPIPLRLACHQDNTLSDPDRGVQLRRLASRSSLEELARSLQWLRASYPDQASPSNAETWRRRRFKHVL